MGDQNPHISINIKKVKNTLFLRFIGESFKKFSNMDNEDGGVWLGRIRITRKTKITKKNVKMTHHQENQN